MDLAERGEPLGVVPPEVAADGLVGVEAEELADDLDGYDLRVGELGGRAALAYALAFEPIVYETEDGHDEGAKIHEKGPPSLGLVWAPSSVERSPSLFNRLQKLAHGVSYCCPTAAKPPNILSGAFLFLGVLQVKESRRADSNR